MTGPARPAPVPAVPPRRLPDREREDTARLLGPRAGRWATVRAAGPAAAHRIREVLALHHGVFLRTRCGRFFRSDTVTADPEAPRCCACRHLARADHAPDHREELTQR